MIDNLDDDNLDNLNLFPPLLGQAMANLLPPPGKVFRLVI